jgi:hypothetical protein
LKKLFFILILNGFVGIVSAQIKQDLTAQSNVQNDLDAITNLKTDSVAETTDKENITPKNRKGFIKKVFSNYQEFDFRNAWGLLSQKQ